MGHKQTRDGTNARTWQIIGAQNQPEISDPFNVKVLKWRLTVYSIFTAPIAAWALSLSAERALKTAAADWLIARLPIFILNKLKIVRSFANPHQINPDPLLISACAPYPTHVSDVRSTPRAVWRICSSVNQTSHFLLTNKQCRSASATQVLGGEGAPSEHSESILVCWLFTLQIV